MIAEKIILVVGALAMTAIAGCSQSTPTLSPPMNTPDLMRNSANNCDAEVSDETFTDCVAEGVHFDGASLTRVSFIRCDLYWATFSLATLTSVTFDHCDLRGADFGDVTLVDCRFIDCDVGTDAIGGETSFEGTDLSSVDFVNCRGR